MTYSIITIFDTCNSPDQYTGTLSLLWLDVWIVSHAIQGDLSYTFDLFWPKKISRRLPKRFTYSNKSLQISDIVTLPAAWTYFKSIVQMEGQRAAQAQAQQENAVLSKVEKIRIDQSRRADALDAEAKSEEAKVSRQDKSSGSCFQCACTV